MTLTTLTIALLCAVIIVMALLVLLLRRRPDAALEGHQQALEQALRDEQRDGRSELRLQLDGLSRQQEQRIDAFGGRLDLLRETLNEDARKARAEQGLALRDFATALDQRIGELTRNNEARLGEMRATLEARLRELQADNALKLDQMRATVDEKLHATLETRLTESFGNVTTMLAQVHRGLGDMHKLAADVGGLQRVLTNVKSRGVFGEVQLAGLLEQVLAPDQFAANVATVPGSNERVEFAVKFPGSTGEATVWLPIDAKFPREDYERLLDAQDRADAEAVNTAAVALERRLRDEAKKIREKYLSPPHTTDFALLFLPTEGLYAEALRRPGLFDALQREQRVTLVGPTTLLALLNSLQMGFRTLAIEQRSSEVWQLLGAVKTEFGKFGAVLEKTRAQLDTVRNSIDAAGVRTRAIERKLRGVESLAGVDSQRLLGEALDGADED
jgi:DNA recombination protein RmuC